MSFLVGITKSVICITDIVLIGGIGEKYYVMFSSMEHFTYCYLQSSTGCETFLATQAVQLVPREYTRDSIQFASQL